jgi:hypothetical protein
VAPEHPPGGTFAPRPRFRASARQAFQTSSELVAPKP